MVNGKVKEMDRILQKVAKWNKLDYRELRKNITQNIDFFNVEKMIAKESLLEVEDVENKPLTVEKYSIITILKNRSVLLISLLMCFAW